ncbi:TPA: hypothetical protein L4967_004971 [Pseudomonas aeruginosa]|nr:hypothetical protein [Pseudomonas aeruginosa]HEP9173704.1 hypothetical protein [Pseudomonas aeruginosa]
MHTQRWTLAIASTLLAGCASVELQGTLAEKCPLPSATAQSIVPSQLGFVEQIERSALSSGRVAPMRVPGINLLSKPIDENAVRTGLTKARQNLQQPIRSLLHVQSGAELIPWLADYSTSPPPAQAAEAANKARSQIGHLWSSVPGAATSFTISTVSRAEHLTFGQISTDEVRLTSEIENTLSAGGYDALTLAAYGELIELLESPPNDRNIQIIIQQAQEFNTSRFISTYLRAYFRGGQMLQMALDAGALSKNLVEDIAENLNNDIPLTDSQKKQLISRITTYLQSSCRVPDGPDSDTCLLSRSLGDDSFITRAGLSVQFAGASLSINKNGRLTPALTYPQSTEFGPQLARVILEAVFDSHSLIVPAASNSTACKTGLFLAKNCLSEPDIQNDKDAFKLTKQIKNIEMYAAQAEATVTATASQAIRGLSVASLNNEAIAKTLETMAGVSARKIVEKSLWNRHLDGCDNNAGTVAVWVTP